MSCEHRSGLNILQDVGIGGSCRCCGKVGFVGRLLDRPILSGPCFNGWQKGEIETEKIRELQQKTSGISPTTTIFSLRPSPLP